MKRVLLLLIVAAGCGKQDAAPSTTTASPADTTQPRSAQGSADLPEMPRYPDAGRAHMAVISAGANPGDTISRDWQADAGWCASPPMLLVKSEMPGVGGTLVLLALPEDRITTYPVTIVTEGLPEPPAAQVGVQVFRSSGPQAYQATEGSVDLYAFGKTVSGRFAVTLREISRNTRIRYAGAFREVPLVQLAESLCAPAASGATPAR